VFTFGAKPEEKENREGSSQEETEKLGGETGGDGSEADRPQLSSTSVHDEEGEGEEDEETTHSIRSKVYRFQKKEPDAEGKWIDIGIGILRLKKHKENGGRRLLMRNSSTGRVLINFKMYAGLAPKMTSNTIVAFTGHEAGAPVNYKLRVKTPEDATQLKDALEREIEFVRGKSE